MTSNPEGYVTTYKLTAEQVAQIEHDLLGSCSTVVESLRRHDLDEGYEDEVNERLGEIERCECCGWWVESHELEGDDDSRHCGDCR